MNDGLNEPLACGIDADRQKRRREGGKGGCADGRSGHQGSKAVNIDQGICKYRCRVGLMSELVRERPSRYRGKDSGQ